MAGRTGELTTSFEEFAHTGGLAIALRVKKLLVDLRGTNARIRFRESAEW
jgi:hypothetical protein